MYDGQTTITNELNPLGLKLQRPCELEEEVQAYNTPNKTQDVITWFCAPSKSETRPTQARPQELHREVEGRKVKGKNLRSKSSSETTRPSQLISRFLQDWSLEDLAEFEEETQACNVPDKTQDAITWFCVPPRAKPRPK